MSGRLPSPTPLKLTRTERLVLAGIHRALDNKTIATELACTVETVKRHLTHIFDKVGCSTRLELFTMTVGLTPEAAQLAAELAASRKETAEVRAELAMYERVMGRLKVNVEVKP